ncbi:MAG: sugar phosphate nucleotidyltransferase [Pyrinomonadaceae bacterium]
MKIIVLAAGYATRLYPLTLTRPKPLLEVAGRPMINHVLDGLRSVPDVTGIYVVTNAKFAQNFQAWANDYQFGNGATPIKVINDKSTDDSNKLGAIGDLHLVLQREAIGEDVIVVAGDNLFNQSLEGFAQFGRQKNAPVVAVYDVGDLEQIKNIIPLRPTTRGASLFLKKSRSTP